jgi:hypothetical protein
MCRKLVMYHAISLVLLERNTTLPAALCASVLVSADDWCHARLMRWSELSRG